MSGKILLVEDDAIIALSETHMMRKHGFEVVTVCSGEKAVAAVESDPDISLILMDIDLGKGIDGTEAAKIILKKRDIPIIFLTSHSEKEYVDRVRKISGYGYVLKDSRELVLIESINMAYTLFSATRKIRESEAKYRAAFMTSPDSININRLDGLYVDINEGFTALTGFTRGDVIGKLSSEIEIWAIPEDREKLVSGLKKKGFVDNLESLFRCKDGSFKTAVMSARIISIENEPHILSITRDITGKKTIEKSLSDRRERFQMAHEAMKAALTESERRRRNAQKLAKTGHWEWSITNDILTWSEEVYRIFAQDPNTFHPTAENFEALIHPEDLEYFIEERTQALAESRDIDIEHRIIRPDGEVRYVHEIAEIARDEDGTVIQVNGVVQDITDRKKIEEQLSASLRQKNLLMQELNHRVKNNLLMISSLINMKESISQDSTSLSDIRSQIDAIRIIHEKLNKTEDFNHIEVSEYIRDLLHTIFSSFSARPVQTEVSIDEIYFDKKTLIPLGLIINEIATNAIKHGFNSASEPRFFVGLDTKPERDRCIMTLSNSGNPFPESINISNCESLGMRLIHSLTSQLNGKIELQKSPSPVYTLSFPMRNEHEQ